MPIGTLTNSLKNVINQAQPQQLADIFRALKLGNILRAMPTSLNKVVPVAAAVNPFIGATLGSIPTPDDAKAATVLRAYARSTSAAGTLGELTVKAPGVVPADGEIGVSPSGDIVVLAASAYTAIDLVYLPEKSDTVEFTLAVVPGTGVCLLPTNDARVARGVMTLIEAESTAGGVVGKKIVLAPGAVNPATPSARLSVAKTQVNFTVADAVTLARVKFSVAPDVDVNAQLEAISAFL